MGEGVALLRRLHGAGRYQYIVADFGSALAVKEVRDEIIRAGTCLVVVSPAPWRREGTLPLVAAAVGLAARVRVLVSPAGDPGGVRDALARLGLQDVSATGLPPADLAGEIPHPSPETDAALAEALAPVFAPAPRRGSLFRRARR